ncbi:MAG: hypothetical protein AAF512_14285 [Pseudomonadota bacterium]
MRTLIGICCFILLSHSAIADVYLEGISILGSKRSAFVSENGQKFSVAKGDKLGQWIVEKIENRSIILRGKDGKLKELALHTTLASEAPKQGLQGEQTADGSFKPRFIKDEEVPEGYRKVATPFGDILVQEATPSAPPPDEEYNVHHDD